MSCFKFKIIIRRRPATSESLRGAQVVRVCGPAVNRSLRHIPESRLAALLNRSTFPTNFRRCKYDGARIPTFAGGNVRCASTALVACKGAPIPPELGPHSSSALRAWCAPGPHGSLPWWGRRRRTLSLVTGKTFHFSFFRNTFFTRVRVFSTAVVIPSMMIGGFGDFV